ncbi:peroxin [Entomortierella lignicola]|nr:peroxin [Entomortierella lignicola]
MLSSVQGFVNRHRRGLAVTAGVTGGIYLMGKYAKSKLIEFHEKTASQRTAEENMKRRFEQNQQDCVFTVLSLLPTLGDQLLHELNVELITAKLQQNRSQRATPLPTPDGSVILTPKSADSAAVFTTPTTTTTSVNGDDSEQNKTESGEEQENGSEQKDDEKSTAEDTTQETDDKPKVNGDSEKHEADGVIANGDSKSESETDPEKETTSENETTQKEPASDGSSPEVQVQQEDSESTESQEVKVSEETATQLQKAAQAAVKDEVAAALDRRVKLELWNELKIMSFTRTVTALYSLTFLSLLTQIQLNLLGRFTYVSSVIALANTTDASYRVESPAVKGSLTSTNGLLDFQTEKKYLTFSYWLLHEGWRRWSDRVRDVIDEVVGAISLKRTLNAKEFSDLLGEIRARLEYTEVDGKQVPVNMREYLLPDDPEEERDVLRAGGVDEFDLVVDPVLRNLLDETRDLIDSEDFSTVLSSALATTFARFNLALQPTFNPFLLSGRGNSVIEEIENDDDIDRSVPLASLLSLISRQAHLIINGVPNEYVESLSMVKELQAFSAIVYSSFNDRLVSQ